MLSTRLVTMIEDHAEELSRNLIRDVKNNNHTAHFRHASHDELQELAYGVYRNLGEWLSHKSEEAIDATYSKLAHDRYDEGIPLSEVVYALILTKEHLREYVRSSSLLDTAVELYQEQELRTLVGRFFDKAIYCTVRGYEREAARRHSRNPHADVV